MLDREIAVPPTGAAWVKVTVQVVEAFVPIVPGEQASELRATGTVRDRLTD